MLILTYPYHNTYYQIDRSGGEAHCHVRHIPETRQGSWVDPGAPKQMPPNAGSGIIWAGKRLHDTHKISWKRGLAICLKCGACSNGNRVGHLIDVCPGVPRSSFAAFGLRSYRNGGLPYGPRGKWPLHSRAQAPAIFK